MTPKEKYEFAKKFIKEKGFTAYEIAKAAQLNTSGVQKIIDGKVEKPREDTLDKILYFLEGKIAFSPDPNHPNYYPLLEEQQKKVAELPTEYSIGENKNADKKLFEMQENIIEMQRNEIERLKKILKDKNIPF